MQVSPIPSPQIQPNNTMPQAVPIQMRTNHTPLPNEQFINESQKPLITNPNGNVAAVEATKQLDPQLARIAKQRRQLQLKEQELLTREKALQSVPQSQGIDVERLKSEPLNVLIENGVTYDQLTEAIIKGQGNSEVNALRAKLASLEKGIDQKFEEQNAQARQQVLVEMKNEAIQLARASDEFELVREMRSVPDVVRLIERTYDKTGEILSVPQAMRLVENELFKDAQRIARAKKLQGMQRPQMQAQPQQRQYQGMRTLTNRDTATVPLSPKQRAMAAFYGNLKR
jgi:hypothetical protein